MVVACRFFLFPLYKMVIQNEFVKNITYSNSGTLQREIDRCRIIQNLTLETIFGKNDPNHHHHRKHWPWQIKIRHQPSRIITRNIQCHFHLPSPRKLFRFRNDRLVPLRQCNTSPSLRFWFWLHLLLTRW